MDSLTQSAFSRSMIWPALLAMFLLWCVYALVQPFTRPPTQPLFSGDVPFDSVPQRLKVLPRAEFDSLMAHQQARLAAEPLDHTAMKNLTLLLQASGDKARADEAAVLTAKSSLRDAQAQVLALPIMLNRGDIAQSLTSMDAIARTQPKVAEPVFKLLASVAANQSSASQVVQMLEKNPPWRVEFMDWLAQRSDQPQLAFDLLGALKNSASPPTIWEKISLLRHYIAAQKFDTAYFVWLDFLSDAELKKVANIYDGEFDLPVSSLYFDWSVSKSNGLQANTLPRSTGGNDRVLQVEFAGSRNAVKPVSQLLRLLPGAYSFSGQSQAELRDTESRLTWQVSCVGGDSRVFAASPVVSGHSTWSRFDVRLQIPPDCLTQILYLHVQEPASNALGIFGKAQYDSFSIVKLDAANGAEADGKPE
jgi:hypothetical protein